MVLEPSKPKLESDLQLLSYLRYHSPLFFSDFLLISSEFKYYDVLKLKNTTFCAVNNNITFLLKSQQVAENRDTLETTSSGACLSSVAESVHSGGGQLPIPGN